MATKKASAPKATAKETRTTLRKITVKTIGVQPPQKGAEKTAFLQRIQDEGTVWLANIYGVCTGAKAATSDYGDYHRFRGAFRAVNLETGEQFAASAAIFPRFLEEQMLAALEASDKSMEFALKLGASASDSPVGYEYVIEELFPPSDTDPIAAIEQRMSNLLAHDA
jgi:hypothetical protein